MFKKISSYLKAISGAPDYDKYLKSLPDKTDKLLTEQEFYMQAIENKYNSTSVRRCC